LEADWADRDLYKCREGKKSIVNSNLRGYNMLNVDLNTTLGNYTSRYSLVIAIAKQARKHVEEAEADHIILTEKPVTMAINELVSGKYAVIEPETEVVESED
jgi:DNA-directed RNA polymerase subunit K/omega